MKTIKICLDAGHAGKYNRSPANPAYYESDMNWKLHLLQKKYLEQYGFEVILTRPNQETDKGVYERGTYSKGCDLFISDHSNAVGNGINETVDYPVVYVPLSGKGDKIGKMLADCVADAMGTNQKGRIATRQGNSGDYYGVIRGAVAVGVVGILIEHSFHTNTKMTNWLLNESNLDKLARAEAKVIAEYYGNSSKPTEESNQDDSEGSKTLYKVQTGAFKQKGNAEALQTKLKAAGFDTYIVQVDGYYKVQVGAYSVKSNAEAMLAKLKAAGYSDAFITNTTAPNSTNTIIVGSKVKLKSGAKTYTGKSISSFVFNDTWIVLQISGDRVVIDKNISGTNSICTPVNVADLVLLS